MGLTDCQTKVTTETEKGTIQTEHTPISAQPKWPLLKINETVLRLTVSVNGFEVNSLVNGFEANSLVNGFEA